MRVPLRPGFIAIAAVAAVASLAGLPPFALPAVAQPARTVMPMRVPAHVSIPPAQTPTVVISTQGVVSRPADEAFLTATIVTNDDVAANATTRNNEIYAALQQKLAALGIEGSAIQTLSFYVNYVPRPTATPPPMPFPVVNQRYGYVATRNVRVTVRSIDRTGAVVEAALSAGAANVGNAQYALANRDPAYNEALTAALRAAESQARVVAVASGMHLGRLVQVQVGVNGPAGLATIGSVMAAPAANAVPILTPLPVDVRATVTVTYALVP